MAKETLVIPEENLIEVANILQMGMQVYKTSEETKNNLNNFCNEIYEYMCDGNKPNLKNAALPIFDVRQLLIDFCETYAEGQFEDPDDTEGIVDWYLKVKDN